MPVPSFFRVAMPVRGGPGIRPRSAWPRAQPRGIGARDPEVALREPLRVGDPEILPTGFRKSSWRRSEEHTSELQSLMRISYAVFCLKKKNYITSTALTDQKPTISKVYCITIHILS